MNVYGPQSPFQKRNLLDTISWFHFLYPDSPLLIGGDFNLITSLQEKKGGRRTLTPKDLLFKDCIEGCGLIDPIPYEGFLTWNNRRGGDQQIASRLDRFLISDQILNYGGLITTTVLPSSGTDH